MFDIGFWEIGLILVVALLVVGPERMPEFARKAGHWYGKGRRFITNVQDDVQRELRTEELQNMLNQQQEQLHSLQGMIKEPSASDGVMQTVASELAEIETAVSGSATQSMPPNKPTAATKPTAPTKPTPPTKPKALGNAKDDNG